MKHPLSGRSRKVALAVALLPLVLLLAWVGLRAGPLAAVPVTVARVESKAITTELFGIGTVEARATHRIGPTVPGRVRAVSVDAGDIVHAGQVLGEMDPIDLDARVDAQEAALKRASAAVLAAQAQVQEVAARATYAQAQADRYRKLVEDKWASAEMYEGKRQEAQAAGAAARAARANLDAARQDLARLQAERQAVGSQRASMRLVSPVDGVVLQRDADPGTTVVAGQPVLEVVEHGALWVNARFDQQRAGGLRAGQEARVLLRSAGAALPGRVVRVEPRADAVTEEILAKVAFDAKAAPPVGELAEVTVALGRHKPAPVVPNASVRRADGRIGVYLLDDGEPRFVPVVLGDSSLDGEVQVLEGLRGGEQVIVYSEKAIDEGSRVKVVERIAARSRGTP